MNDPKQLTERKAAHLDICTDPRYQVETNSTWFDHISFIHNPLPELSFNQISISSKFLGLPIQAPFFISSMTGGSDGGYALNKDLARAAQEFGIPVGMGSIRILFRKPEVLPHFQFKNFAPDVPVFANIGIVQIRDMNYKDIFEALKSLGVDGLAIHLNPGQELFQPEGDRDFCGLFQSLEKFLAHCPIPVIVKETGFGIPPSIAIRLLSIGVSYVDVAGAGGTNWMRIEDFREGSEPSLGVKEFDDWGIPTALNLASYFGLEKPRVDPKFQHKILASGGIRSAMDGIKSLALGASLFGMALPIAQIHKKQGYEGLLLYLDHLKQTLIRAMLLTGSGSISDLEHIQLLYTQEFQNRTYQYQKG